MLAARARSVVSTPLSQTSSTTETPSRVAASSASATPKTTTWVIPRSATISRNRSRAAANRPGRESCM